MQKINLNKIDIYRFDIFNGHNNILHFITTRNPDRKKDFNICLWSSDEIVSVIENRRILASELGLQIHNFVFQQQKHTNNISTVVHSDSGKGSVDYQTALLDNDAMITNEEGICLVVIGGDCVPVLFYDPVKKVVGAAHSGWRGTAKRIAEQTILKMKNEFGCNPADIKAGIGPSIGPDVYEVDNLVLEAFSKTYKNTSEIFKPLPNDGKYLLDLWKANKIQLIEAGVEYKNIEISEICTFSNNHEFFSARKGDNGRFGCGIMLRKDF